MKLTTEQALNLYHNRHEKFEVCERERKLTQSSYSVSEDMKCMILKMQCDERMYLSEPKHAVEVSFFKKYEIPLTKQHKDDYLKQAEVGNQYAGVNAFIEFRDKIFAGDCEEYLTETLLNFEVMYISRYR